MLKKLSCYLLLFMLVACSDSVPVSQTIPAADSLLVKPAFEGQLLPQQDQQYIDLIVPEYAEIVLIYEDGVSTQTLVNELTDYFFYNKASVEKQPVKKISHPTKPTERQFTVDFIGDHRYVVRVYRP